MKIIRARLKSMFGSKVSEFITVKGRIKSLITENREDNFDFVIDESGRKSVKSFGPDFIDANLVGTQIPIVDNTYFAKFNEDGTIDVVMSENEGALPRESTVKQLEKIRKATKSVTIDDRVPKLKGANLGYEKNFVDSGIESYEDFQKKNKSFTPNWNLKHLKSPFKNESFRNSLSDKVPGLVSSQDGKEVIRDILSKINDENFLNSIKSDDYRMPSKFTIKMGNDVYDVVKSDGGPPDYGFRTMIGMEVNVDYYVLKNGKNFSDLDNKIFSVSNRDAKNLFYSLEKRLRSK